MDLVQPPSEDTENIVCEVDVIAENWQESEVQSTHEDSKGTSQNSKSPAEGPKVASDDSSQVWRLLSGNSQARINRKKEQAVCPICNKVVSCKAYLRIHLRTHTKEKPHQCNLCDRSFSFSNSLAAHVRTHDPERKYLCEFCDKSFVSKNSLRFHQRIHSDQAFECESCGKRFSQKSCMIRHLRCHEKRLVKEKKPKELDIPETKTPECEICGKVFSAAKYLKKHYMLHTGERPFTCEFCNKGFVAANHLTYHRFTNHKKELNVRDDNFFPCHLCYRMFFRKEGLVQHALVHSGEKPYECEVCNRVFPLESSLRVHRLMVHSGQIRFQCENCNKRFRVEQDYETHVKICLKRKPYKCRKCTASFDKKSKLQKHQLVHLKQYFKCEFCNAFFGKKIWFEKHLGTHITECSSVSKNDESSNGSEAVQLVCEPDLNLIAPKQELLTCEVCNKIFKKKSAFEQHRFVHSDVRYECKSCNKSYTKSLHLEKHNLIHHTKKPKMNIFERELKSKSK